LTLAVQSGELVTIVGPSGSGKSTALRLIAGLERGDGEVWIGGEDATGVDAPDRGVSMVFQSFALFPHMTVARNIGFGLESRHLPSREVDDRVRETAAWLGLAELLDRRPAELSGGERQRVALARGVVRRPRVLLMDEPLSNLDAKLRTQTRSEIKRLQRESQLTLVYVTHDQAEALSLGDRVAILDHGRLQQYGTPEDVYEAPANTMVAGFLGAPPMNLVRGKAEGGAFRGGQVRVPLPAGRAVAEGTPLIAGFRPEHATVGPAATGEFEAVVELTETVGHDRLLHLTARGQRLSARPPQGFVAAEGDVVGVLVEAERVRLFDAGGGGAL
jgi:ABC-type sugar transport system ATPase subunit